MQSLTSGNGETRGQAGAMRMNAIVQIAAGMSHDRTDEGRALASLRVTLGKLRDGAYQQGLAFAAGDFGLAQTVANGDVDLGALNPSAYLTMAYRGTGPYPEPLPLRAIAVMPTWDRMFLAVLENTGLTSLADIAARKYPLRLSLRRSPGHGTRFLIDDLLALHGFSLRDLESWGGTFHWVDGPNEQSRMDGIRSGAFDAVFDEGVKGWGYVALQHGMEALDLDGKSRARLEALGWPLGPVRRYFPTLQNEITAVSFGGWPLFTREDLPEEIAYAMCQALEAAWDRIGWDQAEEDPPVQLSDVCEGTDAAPRGVPLHPGAARYYRERGCKV